MTATLDARDQANLRRAIDLACAGVAEGQRPFGAVLTAADGTMLAEGGNVSVRTGDPFDHAEMNVIRIACRAAGSLRLHGGTIYASGEPCSMCAGTILRFGLAKVVFGATEASMAPYFAANPGFVSYPSSAVFAAAGGKIEVIGGALPEEAARPFALPVAGPEF